MAVVDHAGLDGQDCVNQNGHQWLKEGPLWARLFPGPDHYSLM